MLNMDQLTGGEFDLGNEKDAYISYLFDISDEVKVEKRVVTSLIILFGDIGGLRELF